MSPCVAGTRLSGITLANSRPKVQKSVALKEHNYVVKLAFFSPQPSSPSLQPRAREVNKPAKGLCLRGMLCRKMGVVKKTTWAGGGRGVGWLAGGGGWGEVTATPEGCIQDILSLGNNGPGITIALTW